MCTPCEHHAGKAKGARALAAARAVLCHVCPHGERPGAVWQGVVRCSIDGRPIKEHVMSGRCTEGLYGLVRSRWWMGVPRPLRWLARVLGAPAAAVGLIPGCGCIRPAKVAWKRFRRALGQATPPPLLGTTPGAGHPQVGDLRGSQRFAPQSRRFR